MQHIQMEKHYYYLSVLPTLLITVNPKHVAVPPLPNISFLDWTHYFFFQVAPHLSSQGWVKEETGHYSSQYSAHLSARPNNLVVGTTQQQAIVKTPAKWSADQILSVMTLFILQSLRVSL
jgi:hypothetical protein